MIKLAKYSGLFVLSALLLAACNPIDASTTVTPTINPSVSPTVTPSVEIPLVANDVKEAITNLALIPNFSTITKTDSVVTDSASFTEQYYYNKISDSGFLIKEEQLYDFYIVEDEIKNGDAIEDGVLYGSSSNAQITDFSVIDVNYINADKTFSTLKRTNVEPLIAIAGLDSSYYNYLESAVLSVENLAEGEYLTIKMSFETVINFQTVITNTTTSISNFQSTNDEFIVDFIENGELTGEDEDFKKIKELFNTNNFLQTQSDENGNIYQYDFFTEEYYQTVFSNSFLLTNPLYQLSQTGYVEILRPEEQLIIGANSPLIYDDIYRFNFTGNYENNDFSGEIFTRNNPSNPGHAQGAFQTVERDITEVFIYPSQLDLLDMPHLLEKSINANNEVIYSTDESSLIDNLLSDFGLTSYIGSGDSLEMIYNVENTTIDFRIFYSNNTYSEFNFSQFGTAEFKPLEDLLTSLQ